MQTLGHTYSINGKCTTMPLNTLLLEKIGIDCPTVDKKYVSKMQLFALEFSRALAFGIIKLPLNVDFSQNGASPEHSRANLSQRQQ